MSLLGKASLMSVALGLLAAPALLPPTAAKLWGARDIARDLLKVGLSRSRRGPVMYVVTTDVRLDRLPALQLWPEDGGPFVTLPLVFTQHPEVIDYAQSYFVWVAPAYPFFALGLCLYFASQGAGRLLGPVLAGTLRLVVVIAATLGTAAVVSVSGLIGFVGIMVPHLVRLVAGSSYRLVLPLSILVGAAFLILADIPGRMIEHGGETPIGVVTALVGAPMFIFVLRTRRSLS